MKGAMSVRRRVVIQASGIEAGLGHLARAAALAKAIGPGHDVAIQVRGQLPRSVPLFLHGLSVEESTDDTISGDVYVLDVGGSDAVSEVMLGFASSAAPVVVVVDEISEIPVDLAVCPGPHAIDSDLPLWPKDWLVGPRFALVDRSFRPTSDASRRFDAVVSLGGTVAVEEIREFIELLASESNVVVVFPEHLQPSYDSFSSSRLTVEVGLGPTDLATLFHSASIVLTSGGVSSLEAIAAAVPLGVLALNSSQVAIGEAYVHHGLGSFIGRIGMVSQVELAQRALHLLHDVGLHESLVSRCQAIEAWAGAGRVARSIEGLIP